MHQKILRGNLIKNIVLIGILFFSYTPIKASIINSGINNSKGDVGDLLVVVSIIAVIASFGNFAFTYEKVNMKKPGQRIIAHFTTGILMLIIGLSLELTLFFTNLIVTNIWAFTLSLHLLYIGSVLYDYWDLFRTQT
ncbi:hypothetical protein CL634_10425 [bacterium]|nr:hypothetical protein [bacterium]|tara:strand:- start:197 stop:607 length:411 start_codon:yes stop_codon:yes gene_type:complete